MLFITDYHEWVRHCTVCHISELEYRYEPFFEGDTLSKVDTPKKNGKSYTVWFSCPNSYISLFPSPVFVRNVST